MKILLAEDEPILREKLHNHLMKRGHNVQSVPDGQKAWDLFKKDPTSYDVILSDIKMPVSNGLELLERVRHDEYKIPFIFMTGHGELKLSIDALKLGASDFILKPFRYRVLNETLSKITMHQIPRSQMNAVLSEVLLESTIPIKSGTRFVSAVVQYLTELLEPLCQIHKIEFYSIGICLMEALTNAVVHGNLEVSSLLKEENMASYEELVRKREAAPEYFNRMVKTNFQFSPEKITFEVQDEGQGFDWNNRPAYDPLELLEHGRGIIIIQSLMDEVSWNETGNCIRLTKYIQSEAEGGN